MMQATDKQENPTRSGLVTAPELKRHGFFRNVFSGIKSLLEGMKVTFHYLSHPSTVVTQQYPENRATLKMMERYRALLTMIHDENGLHKCTGCQICHDNCPNASINVVTRSNPVSGKKELDRYIWRMDSCTFCNLCVQVCPFGILKMDGSFEGAVYDRRLFVFTLNHYAGPAAGLLAKVADPEERKKMIEPRDRYSGPVPLNGQELAGVKALKKAESGCCGGSGGCCSDSQGSQGSKEMK